MPVKGANISDEMWDKCSAGDIEARNRIVETYYELVFRVVGRMKRNLPPHADEGDLISYGSDGLIRAATNFDRHRGTTFDAFAVAAIRGRVLDAMRAADWAPRSLRKAQREIEAARRELSDTLQRTPTNDEIGDLLEQDGDYVSRIEAETERSHVRSLDEWQEAHAEGALTTPEKSVSSAQVDSGVVSNANATSSFDTTEVQVALGRALSQLTAQHYFVLALYYYEGLTLSKVSRVCGMTESKVNVLHEEAIKLIYNTLSRTLQVS